MRVTSKIQPLFFVFVSNGLKQAHPDLRCLSNPTVKEYGFAETENKNLCYLFMTKNRYSITSKIAPREGFEPSIRGAEQV